MKNESVIFEKKWIDLVFEGRNKEYGAYQLRKENDATTLKALFSAITLLAIVVLALIIQTKLKSEDNPIFSEKLDDPIQLVNIEKPKEQVLPKTEKQEIVSTQSAAAPSIATTMVVVPVENIPNTTPETPITTNITAVTGNIGGTIQSNSNLSNTITQIENTEPSTFVPTLLDRQPSFPGGIEKFCQYIVDRFEKPSLETEQKLRIVLSFIIEKNGTLTDIQVLKNPGYGLDKEAIRVLKSLKTKWEPGYKDGKPVRTAYVLPILVKLE
mgnify:FL=1